MARPTTEFAVLSLVPGANLVDPESEGSRIWRDCLKTLSSFEGFRSSLYSVDEKNTNTMVEIVGKNIPSLVMSFAGVEEGLRNLYHRLHFAFLSR